MDQQLALAQANLLSVQASSLAVQLRNNSSDAVGSDSVAALCQTLSELAGYLGVTVNVVAAR